MTQLSDLVTRFESLGDNCELGVVKRHVKNEEGGLLRWAFSSRFPLLLDAISRRFEGLYAFENLTPWVDNMVLDSSYRIAFHSDILSVLTTEGWRFKESEEERRRIHARELESFTQLKNRLIGRMQQADRCFVYKRNALTLQQEIKLRDAGQPASPDMLTNATTQEEALSLHAALQTYHPKNTLLVLSTQFPHAKGTIHVARPGLMLGSIGTLAPYSNAYECAYDLWTPLLAEAVRLVDSGEVFTTSAAA